MKPCRTYVLTLALYVLLALGLTWPLVTHLATHVPGSAVWAFDEYTFVWNMWWFKFSLLNLGQSPLHTSYIFYPLGIDLVSYTFNLFNAMLGLPLQLALSLPLASNLALLFAYVMGGYGGYLLVSYLFARERHVRVSGLSLDAHIAAFVAGAVYAFAASRMIYAALGHYNMVTVQWFPFYALFLLKTLREPGYRNPILAGIFATLVLLAETFLGVFLLFLTFVLLLFEWRVLRSPSGYARSWRWLISRLAVLGLAAALLWSPVMWPILRAFSQGGFDLAGWGEGLKLSADLVGLFTPTPLHPLLGAADWPAHLRAVVEGHTPFGDVNTVFLGYGILVLAVIGALSAWKQARVWAWGAVIFAIFSLGPLLQIKGRYLFPFDNLLREQGLPQDVTVPLPFLLLHYIPIIKADRVPNRFSVVLSLALAVLVGYGIVALLRRLPKMQFPGLKAVIGCVLLAVVLFDQVSVPLPLTDARVPAPYQVIAAEPEDFAVLQLPLGWRNSFGVRGAERTQIQYYQSLHHKRMLAGNTSRNPDFKFDYFTRIPLFKALTETELYRKVDDNTLAQARAQAGELMLLYDVRYLIVHDPIPLRYPYVDTMPATRDLALSLIPVEPKPVATGDGATVYRVKQPPLSNPWRVDFGDWTSAPYRGEGWEENEEVFGTTANWTLGTEARLFFPVRGEGDRHLALRVVPFAYPGASPQKLTLFLNDHPLDTTVFSLSEGWQTLEATLPASSLRPGLNTLMLRFDHATRPSAVLPGVSDDRPLAGAVDWAEISVLTD